MGEGVAEHPKSTPSKMRIENMLRDLHQVEL